MQKWKDMRKSISKTLLLGVCGASVLTITAVSGQQNRAAAPLTAMDYIEMQQLVATAQFGLYSGADEGRMYSGVFAQDGTFDGQTGTAALTAYAKGGRSWGRSLITNVIIEPTPTGASGRHYEFLLRFLKDQNEPVALDTTGRYDDTFVKTPAGWRIQKRVFVPGMLTSEATKAAVPAAPADANVQRPAVPAPTPLTRTPKNAFTSTLTPLDYIQIQQLVASYGQALDNGLNNDDNGEAYASLFAPDGVFGRPYTTGADALKALARTQPHNRRYARHFLTNIVIEPSPGGAVGRQYVIIIDQTEKDRPARVLGAGHYEDIYVKTPAGWKFKQRTLYPARTGPQP
jgi:hypothetical protein